MDDRESGLPVCPSKAGVANGKYNHNSYYGLSYPSNNEKRPLTP
jgi:hypothetical protein